MSMWKHRLAARVFPWHFATLDWINRNALVRQWIAEQRDRIPTFENLFDLHRHVHDEVCGGNAIDFLEFGVCAGTSIRFWSEMNRNPQSRFIGFDSFEGLPEDWTRNYPKGTLSTGGRVPEMDDDRVSFVKGWFQNTLPGFLNGFMPRSRLVVHSDSDLYSSTLFTLVSLNTLLVPETAVILDDFSMATHVFRALADYMSSFMRSAHPVAMTSDYAAQVAFVFD